VSDNPSILCEVESGCAVVTLNEPERRNPLSPSIVDGMIHILKELIGREEVRVIILTGAGRGFCAGADLKRMRTATPLEDRQEYDRILEINQLLWDCPKPTIAVVHGFALGAGANLMSWCDLIVADEEARIGYPEVKAGVPSATVVPTLERLVGRRKMLELTLLGTPISAAEAERIGLINRVAPAGEALAVARGLAGVMAENDPHAMRQTKEIVRTTSEMPYRGAMAYAKEFRVIVRLRKGFDVRVSQGGEQEEGR
jgi:methylglutaconyl-CoA hydratase